MLRPDLAGQRQLPIFASTRAHGPHATGSRYSDDWGGISLDVGGPKPPLPYGALCRRLAICNQLPNQSFGVLGISKLEPHAEAQVSKFRAAVVLQRTRHGGLCMDTDLAQI